MKIDTNGKDFIVNGHIFHADKDGKVEVPDDVLSKDKVSVPAAATADVSASRVAELEAENEKLKAEIAELNALIEDDGTSDEKEAMLAKAKELGIEADGRWGVKKLKAAIAEKAGA